MTECPAQSRYQRDPCLVRGQGCDLYKAHKGPATKEVMKQHQPRPSVDWSPDTNDYT